jgi:glycosyltransferase involved in cell wall biosynthesis
VLGAAPAEREAMGAAGRARVEAEFDQARSAERLLELVRYAT